MENIKRRYLRVKLPERKNEPIFTFSSPDEDIMNLSFQFGSVNFGGFGLAPMR